MELRLPGMGEELLQKSASRGSVLMFWDGIFCCSLRVSLGIR